jgi:chromosome condensin MukBEF ATPase and DNA-binding subunit MukB
VLRTIRDALSSPNALAAAAAVAIISMGLALYVVFAQINLTNCLADYNEASARSTAARSTAAAEDRSADLEERNLAETERQRQAENDTALDKVLYLSAQMQLGQATRADVENAFRDLLNVRAASAKVRAANQVKRAELARRRYATELQRQQNPIPSPPSTMCGGNV